MDDARIRVLNRTWRNLDKSTDVLSWPQEDEGFASVHLGDVVISLETAVRQANARGWGLNEEVALLLVHGLLHLLGHEEETWSGASAMRTIETGLLGKPLDTLPGGARVGTIPAC